MALSAIEDLLVLFQTLRSFYRYVSQSGLVIYTWLLNNVVGGIACYGDILGDMQCSKPWY